MATRTIVLIIALVATLGFAYLTLNELTTNGLNVLSALSLLVLALFGFGIVGALLHPPEK